MADLLQILQRTGVKATATFYSGGVATDSGTQVKVDVVRPDGTLLVTQANATDEPGDGIYGYQLAPQADPTLLRLDWSGTIGGVAMTVPTRVEVLGALLFTIPELRALKIGDEQPFSTTATPAFTDAQLHEARAATLDEFEHFLGYCPVPRHARGVLDGDGSGSLLLGHIKTHHPPLSVTINGTTQPVGSYTLKRSGVLVATSNYAAAGTFTAGVGNVAVEYVHGEQRVMGDGGVVAMARVAQRLIPGFSSAARSVTTPDGVTYDLGDMAGQVTRAGTTRRFGIPMIDAWLSEHRQVSGGIA